MGARNLNKGGLEVVLITSLKQYVANVMGVVADIYPYVLANMAGDNFKPLAHWEILTPDGTSIIRYESMIVKDINFMRQLRQALQGKKILQHPPKNITTKRSLIGYCLFNT